MTYQMPQHSPSRFRLWHLHSSYPSIQKIPVPVFAVGGGTHGGEFSLTCLTNHIISDSSTHLGELLGTGLSLHITTMHAPTCVLGSFFSYLVRSELSVFTKALKLFLPQVLLVSLVIFVISLSIYCLFWFVLFSRSVFIIKHVGCRLIYMYLL